MLIKTLTQKIIIITTAFILACSGGEGTLVIKMTDGPIDAKLGRSVEEVNVTIREISVKQMNEDDNGFKSVTQGENKVNLIEYLNGLTTTLGQADLDAGDYGEIRVTVSEENTIKFANDATLYSLKIPSGVSSGVKIKTSFTIEDGKETEITIDFDAAESITEKGNGTYNMNPVIKVKKIVQ